MAADAATASATASAKGPYIGLSYYTEADGEWFFGREGDAQTIVGNLRAARLTILHAPSGAGKSSLLRAGVARQLLEWAHRQLTERGSPGYVPVVFSEWKDDPVADLIAAIETAIQPFLGAAAPSPSPLPLPRSLTDAVRAAALAVDAELLIVLDQFEEYLLYHAQGTARGSFADELARSVTDPDARANFLIAIRDDAYASLGELFGGRIPNVYGNYLQLEYLDGEAAREAIVGPLEHFNELHRPEPPIAIEPPLVEAVLREVRTEEGLAGGTEQPATAATGNGARAPREQIETPYLQLVMARLWSHEREHGSHVLRLATLKELGGAREIVRTHLDGELDALSGEDYATALDMFHYLVTPSGTKIAFAASDLAKLVERPYERVAALLAHLAAEDTRILRHVPPPAGKSSPSDRYELYHDVLAPAIVDWRRRALEQRKHAQERLERERLERERKVADERAKEEARRRQAFQRLAIGTIGLLAVAVVLGVLAWLARRSAVAELKTAQASQLVASSERTLPSDARLSTLLALRALHLRYSSEAEATLRAALPQLQETKYLPRLGSSVNSAVFSPDGADVLTGTEGGSAIVWNATNGKRLQSLDGHAGAVERAAFSPDATQIATADKGGTAILWDASSGRELRVLDPRDGPVYDAAFSPDGRQLVTADKGGTAIVWDLASGKRLRVLHGRGAFRSAVFSHDGTEVLTTSEAGAVLWNAADGARLGVLPAPVGGFEDAAFNSDGSRIVTAGEDGTARIWETRSDRQLVMLSGVEGAIEDAAFSPDGREVVTADQDRTARVWDVATGKQIMALAGDEGPVRSVAYRPDGSALVTAGQDGTTRIWDASPRELITLLPSNEGAVLGASFDPAGDSIVTANQDSTATVWNLASRRQTVLRGHRGPVYAAGFSPDGKLAVTAGVDGTARVWNANSGLQQAVLAAGGGHVDSAVFDSRGTQVLTASSGGQTEIWQAPGWTRAAVLPSHSGAAEDASFDRSGDEVITAYEDGTATVWDVARRRPLARLRASEVALLSAAFSPDGREVVTAGKDGAARTWSLPGGKLLLTLRPQGGPIYSAAFSPNGRTILTASEDGEIRLWGARSGKQLTDMGAREGVVFGAAFNATGSEIVSANQDGNAELWSTELASPLRPVERIAAGRITHGLDAQQRRAYPAG